MVSVYKNCCLAPKPYFRVLKIGLLGLLSTDDRTRTRGAPARNGATLLAQE